MSCCQETKQKKKQKKKKKLRRKKDMMINMPFIIAYMGDPAQSFRCHDIINDKGEYTYELILPINIYVYGYVNYPVKAFERLKLYMNHKVDVINGRVLVWKAGVVYE
jgi:hypothetical protein